MSDPNLPNGDSPQQPVPPAAHAPVPTYGAPPGSPLGQHEGYPSMGVPQPAQPKGLALSSMIVGIVSLVLCAIPFIGIIGGIVAVILGIVALKKVQSKGMSITGVITGAIAFLASIVILVASLVFLGGVSNATSSALEDLAQVTEELESTAPVATEEPEPEPAAEPEWTTVATISGSADQQSDTIVLTGGKVRVTYDFVDSSGYGTIVGAVYVLTEGTDVMTDGGIPDVMVSEAGSGDTILRKSAGEYYVRVTSANASYTVTVEEQK